MCTDIRSFLENWEYLYFPRRSKETVHRVQSAQFSSRELKYFRSRKVRENDVFHYFFLAFAEYFTTANNNP